MRTLRTKCVGKWHKVFPLVIYIAIYAVRTASLHWHDILWQQTRSFVIHFAEKPKQKKEMNRSEAFVIVTIRTVRAGTALSPSDHPNAQFKIQHFTQLFQF